MSATELQLNAGGLLPPKTKVDKEATEQVVARQYHHAALGERAVVRLASDRLGQAEDLAMEFLGFDSPQVSKPLAVQQRRSLGFAAWALINDPDNAHFALDLVKQMKAADRRAKSKPGHAWDSFTEMSQELGRSARHFLPPFWEEVGRSYKDLGNQTYAGRAFNKSLQAERVHALESDRARRRDAVLEFVLAGCLSGKALSDYADDLQAQYTAGEAFDIFRDLCVRRTRGGMAPWAAMPKDLMKLAKAAELDANAELESFLEEVIETPAMGRAANQFWKSCSKHCQRIVARNPAFAVALLRHTRPVERFYGESSLGPWLDLLQEWGVEEFIWTEGHRDAPPLGEPVAIWFSRIIGDEQPPPTRVLHMLDKLTPRLKQEKTPLPLTKSKRYGSDVIDIDVLETCLSLGIKLEDPSEDCTISFAGWLMAEPDHAFRNRDIVESANDSRFTPAVLTGLAEALTCRGGGQSAGWNSTEVQQRPFPLAAADREGIVQLWHHHASAVVTTLEDCGLAAFVDALQVLAATFWPDTFRLFPDLQQRLEAIDPAAVLELTLQAGVIDEYGLPHLERVVEENKLAITHERFGDSNLSLAFPKIVVADKIHAHVIDSDGTVTKHELRLPKGANLGGIAAVGEQLAVSYRHDFWEQSFYWTSDRTQVHDMGYGSLSQIHAVLTELDDGSFFNGSTAFRPGDETIPGAELYFHDRERFWRFSYKYDHANHERTMSIREIDPHTGKSLRESVPAWFEQADSDQITFESSELMPAPPGAEESPLGCHEGMLGWKTYKRRDGSYYGEGIDGRRWEKPLPGGHLGSLPPLGLLRQVGTDNYLPISTVGGGRYGQYWLWNAEGTTTVAHLQDFDSAYATGQVVLLPLHFWHLLKPRHEASSKKLRSISSKQCQSFMTAAAKDREEAKKTAGETKAKQGQPTADRLNNLLSAVKKFLPKAPSRMVEGVARIIERGEIRGNQFVRLREKMIAESKQESSGTSLVVNTQLDNSVQHWELTKLHAFRDDKEFSLHAHLIEAAAFLKGESEGGSLPSTKLLWFPLLDNLYLHCWQTYWRTWQPKTTARQLGCRC